MKTALLFVLALMPLLLSADDNASRNAQSLKVAIKGASAEALNEGKSYYLVTVYVSDIFRAEHTINAVYAYWYDSVYVTPAFQQEMNGALLVRLIGFPLKAIPRGLTGIPTYFAGKAGSDTIHPLPVPSREIQGDPAKFIAFVKEQLAAMDASNPPAKSGNASTSPDAKTRTQVVDAKVSLKASTPNAYDLGSVQAGDEITLQYLGGKWKDHGHFPTANPDDPKEADVNRLVIAMPAKDGLPGEVVAIVPANTAEKPFHYVPEASGPLVLRINAHSDSPTNPGEVVYQLKISR